jgi:hypothetical protein
MTDASSPAVAQIAEAMSRFRTEMEDNDRRSLAISIRTKWMVKFGSVLLAMMGVVLIFQILHMRAELLLMIQHLDAMYLDFGIMAKDLDVMTGQVAVIQGRVAGLPSVAADMTSVNSDVGSIGGAVGAMTDHVRTITGDVALLRDTTREMGYHFNNVQQSVDYMSHNVGQMLRPLSVLPR